MLDSDLAILYGCVNGTKDINKAVKRNIERFPSNFYFQITKSELDTLLNNNSILRFQNGTLKNKNDNLTGMHYKYLPYVFTEQGVAMLSSVLRTKDASRVSVNIMNAFVEMRKFINKNKDVFNKISVMESMLIKHDIKIDEIFSKFDNKLDFKNKLFFNGEVYDAYSLLVDIIRKAESNITIIDNYVDKVTLDILSKKNINVTILLITDNNKSKLTKTEIDKFNKEYPRLDIKYTNIFHDRFILLDNKDLYHLGASLKDLGNKVFAITKIEDSLVINSLRKKINSL